MQKISNECNLNKLQAMSQKSIQDTVKGEADY